MKTEAKPRELPKSVLHKLKLIRRRALKLELLDGLIRSLIVLLAVVVVAMALDWMIGWFDSRVRFAITFLALGLAAVTFAVWVVRPLFHRRSIVATAREVDQVMPELEERWSTITELSQNDDPPEIRGSEAMIDKIAQEAATLDARITPEAIVPARSLRYARRGLMAAVAVFVLLFVLNFSQSMVLWQRFWLPGQDISLTHLRATPADIVVPKGEPLTLAASVSGWVRDGATKLLLRPEEGPARQIDVSPKADKDRTFEHAIPAVTASFDYRFRSGDGQTPWHRITAVDRPKISGVKLSVVPPSYTRLPKEEKDSLPGQLRILEGSELQVSFRSDQPLDRMVLNFEGGPATELSRTTNDWYQFVARPTNTLAFTAVLVNKFQLENKIKPACRVSVYQDLPPAVNILEPSDDIAVRPGEKVNINFEAVDDFGIAKAELIVTPENAGESNTVRIPIPLGDEAGKKEIQKNIQLDLDQFKLKQGDRLSYVVQVTDSKQNPAQSQGAQNLSPQENQPPPASAEDTKLIEAAAKTPDSTPSDRPPAEAQPGENKPADAARDSNAQSSLAKQSEQSEKPPSNASSPPPNEMAKRTLDVGQSSACKPRNIAVDEWAGRFEGEKRQKQEMAIDPILKRLAELLAKAQEQTDSLKQPASLATGLDDTHLPAVKVARETMAESDRAIAELKSRSAGTPYAFLGLQVHNIGEAHLTPARQLLAAITLGNDQAKEDAARVDKTSFHITRAREMLADLTKTYETVKRDQKIADAMQKLNKMHQIFLEDSQAFLGNKKGPINSFERKIAEVDDAYAEQLKQLLKEKEKIIAELARLLADDPRLLRRYLAMLQLQGTTYRDQLTLLAERQQRLQGQVTKWNATPADERSQLLQQLRDVYAGEQRQVVQDATKLHENMATWLPLDLKPDTAQIKAALTKAEKLVNLAGETALQLATNATTAVPDSGRQVMEQLRSLREDIQQLQTLEAEHPKITEYIANRLPEVEMLISAQSACLKIHESFVVGNFSQAAVVAQHRIAQDTAGLGDKLAAVETQVSSMSEEIQGKAALLNKTVQSEIIAPQAAGGKKLAAGELQPAEAIQTNIVQAFARAEQTFDELIRLIIEKLDAAPPPSAPGQNRSLDNVLAMLENELKANEGLGIPCRPINVSIMKDWMRPGSGSGAGQGQARAQAKAAQTQTQNAKAQTERVQKEARNTAKQAAQAASKKEVQSNGQPTIGPQKSQESWNTLVSKLDKDLLQGRDNTLPEQYRKAIENYFKIISEKVPTTTK